MQRVLLGPTRCTDFPSSSASLLQRCTCGDPLHFKRLINVTQKMRFFRQAEDLLLGTWHEKTGENKMQG